MKRLTEELITAVEDWFYAHPSEAVTSWQLAEILDLEWRYVVNVIHKMHYLEQLWAVPGLDCYFRYRFRPSWTATPYHPASGTPSDCLKRSLLGVSKFPIAHQQLEEGTCLRNITWQ